MNHAPAVQLSKPFEVSNRLVLAIAVPMTLAYSTTPLLGLVDTAVVGQFGDAALLGGLAAGAIIFDVVFSSFNFLRSGTTGLVAQAFGRDDTLEQRAVFLRACIIAIVCGLAMVLLSPFIATLGEWFMGAASDVTAAMDTYIRIRLLSSPAALLNYAILGYFLGRGEANLGLLLQLVLNGVNIVLSIWLGLHLGWGVAGVAWGTLCGETITALLGLTIIARRFSLMPKVAWGSIFAPAAMRRMLALNGDIMIRSFVLMGAFTLLTRQGAQLGTLTLAANAVLMHFFMVSTYFLDGFATAVEQLAGRAVGARYLPAFNKAIRLTLLWGFGMAGVASVLVLLCGDHLITVITTAEEVRAEAAYYLPWAAFAALSGVMAFQMDGVFIGATWSRDMRNMMLLSFVAFAAALLVFGHYFGNHGLWAALHVFLITRGLSLLAILPRSVRATFAG
ncbi:putative MATE family efflux protein [Pseudaminobacter salicylatoxidans]|uniref:Putative MATE family efflux protein n=1 Tax=Pseudaminobacter salicylatoxidans TaxID=93369 RepID=A0A316C0S7_PSESE|nr:MATE family efflux transporter [Pseudaminobacter salicylatoxidans]PWJ81610.1 putative MATE family efflux protein [Pseudaminobacter salicylatoxidans]